jgi:serine/threonine-protein kinase PRP4
MDEAVVNATSVEEENEALAREEVALAQEERDAQHTAKAFDIFSASPTVMSMATGGLKRINKAALMEGDDPLLESNWDDGEGYYSTRIGEVICDRYRVMGEVGKGVFSTAVKCIDSKKHDALVVLKIIRNNDIMRKASEKEIFLLQLIAQTDPQNKKHCVRLLTNTEYRNHIVIAFEALGMNLRETVKRFGKHVGINVTAVRLYARQLFVALKHLAELKIVHADIKPDNILVSEDLKQVKICDFGSAFRETDTDNDPTPYLQSRFYRAPEIVLGLHYDRMIDLWSIGACIYELFTGHVMFAGRTNNEMIRLHMDYKGKIPNKVLKAHHRSFEALQLDPHFDADFKFKMHDIDPVTNKPIMRLVDITGPKKNIASILLQSKVSIINDVIRCLLWHFF